MAALARLKERFADLADQAAWVTDTKSRDFLLERTRHCLDQLK
jgi:hypothetical protein